MQINDTQFGISCATLSATLSALNFNISHLDRSDKSGRVKFVFEVPDGNEFFEVIDQFHRGELQICPKLFAYHHKQLKNRLYAEQN